MKIHNKPFLNIFGEWNEIHLKCRDKIQWQLCKLQRGTNIVNAFLLRSAVPTFQLLSLIMCQVDMGNNHT